jgi:hypothetical protein
MYESLNHGFMNVTKDLYGLKTLEYVSTLKKIPTIFAKESALIPLVIY